LGGNTTAEDRLIGLRLITYGLFKKFVVANRLSEYVNAVFDEKQGVSTFAALIACCFNALQLYADFSGYVDIAIGSARFLGIRLDPNFDRPFVSTSVTEFWRRWHITLAVWLRDYLYMPLLIRIRDLGKTGIVVAMMVTFAICGIWHGATWTFLLFGVAQGVAMSTEMLTKSWRTKRLKQYPKQWVTRVGLLYTLSFFALSQVMFRSADLSQAQQFYRNLFSLRLPHSAAELSAYGGPFFFILDFVVIGLWVAIASYLPKVSNSSTPPFMFVCALLILFFGRLGSAHFIYAAF
jgi:D-alanyl-lipoteichoic acid acyltransferase DltB (MBOAT superfamily)